MGWIGTTGSAVLPALLSAVIAGGSAPVDGPAFCPDPDDPGDPGSEYYAIEMVSTKRVPGTARAGGEARVVFAESPFGVAVGSDGSYLYDVHLELEGFGPRQPGVPTVWFTTTSLDRVVRAGTLEAGSPFVGRVGWNKFLVVVTLEPEDADPGAAIWSGPIVMRGMSRSGMMHTMAGHGPYQQENCATYGY